MMTEAEALRKGQSCNEQVWTSSMVCLAIGNAFGVLEQLCARVRAETWGRAATAPGSLSHMARDMGQTTDMLQDAGIEFGKGRRFEWQKLVWRVEKTGAS